MNATRRWAALPPDDRLRLPMMMLALPLVSFSLRLFGYKRTLRLVEWLSHPSQTRIASSDDLSAAQHLAELVAVAGRRGPIKANCLRQSLLVYGLLRHHGLRPEIKFGVRRESNGISAHAWVDLHDNALAQADLEHTPFPNPTESS